jgi:hypothetical protein
VNVKRSVIGTIIATSLAAGGVFVASDKSDTATPLPTPAVFTSTLTLSHPDSVAVVIGWTNRCSPTNVCPVQWRVAARVNSEPPMTKTRGALRDTLRAAKAVCPQMMVITAAVIADPSTVGSTRETASSLTGYATALTVPCRKMTNAEAAQLDSYPQTNTRMMVPGTLDKALQIGDSIKTICWFGRNRYTGKVISLIPDPENRCEADRKKFESERSG